MDFFSTSPGMQSHSAGKTANPVHKLVTSVQNFFTAKLQVRTKMSNAE
jgi:hypothetical protein